MATAEPIQNGTSQPLTETTATFDAANLNPSTAEPDSGDNRWPGWPGHCVFRLIVPVLKVGIIIGRKGELIKKTCEETRARIRVLDAPIGTNDRIVLVTGKEDLEAPLSPAMDAVIKVFKRVSGLSEVDGMDKTLGAACAAFCSIRLLVASTQAISLIGKQGSLIKSIQESTGASVRVLSGDELPFYAADEERIVDLQGENLKVLKALEAVLGHLRKFLVDYSVLPLFEKSSKSTISQDGKPDVWADKPSLYSAPQPSIVADIPLSTRRDSLFVDRESQLNSLLSSSTMSLYGQDSSLSGLRSSALSRANASIVTTVIQTMQIPLSYAEDIIGVQGTNIDFIRRTSGAILTVQESRVPDEIIVEIKGTSSEVQMAQQLIQNVISNHKETVASSYGRIDTGLRPSYSHLGNSDTGLRPSYSQLGNSDTGLRPSYSQLGNSDTGLRPSYSQLGNSSYSSSSLSSQPHSGYGGSSNLGGYSTFRL